VAGWAQPGENETPRALYALSCLGSTLEAEGKLAEAEQVRREALALWRKRGTARTAGIVRIGSPPASLWLRKSSATQKKLLDEALTPAFVEQPSSAGLLALMVDLKARRGRWQEAAADAALAIKHQPFHETRFPVLAAASGQNPGSSRLRTIPPEASRHVANTTNFYVADSGEGLPLASFFRNGFYR